MASRKELEKLIIDKSFTKELITIPPRYSVKKKEDCEEIVANAYADMWRKPDDKLLQIIELKLFTCRVVINKTFEWIKDNKKLLNHDVKNEASTYTDPLFKITIEQIEKLILKERKNGKRDLMIFRMITAENSGKEIAEAIGMNELNARQVQFELKKWLRQKISNGNI